MIDTVPKLIKELQRALDGGTSDNFALYLDGQPYEIEEIEMQGTGAPIAIHIKEVEW